MAEIEEKPFVFDLNDRGVGTLTLNRPKIHNAFDDKLIFELQEFFQSAETDENIQVVVLTGAGKSFCAGADLNWMKKMANYTDEENLADSKKLATMLSAINNFSKPLVAFFHQSTVWFNKLGHFYLPNTSAK